MHTTCVYVPAFLYATFFTINLKIFIVTTNNNYLYTLKTFGLFTLITLKLLTISHHKNTFHLL